MYVLLSGNLFFWNILSQPNFFCHSNCYLALYAHAVWINHIHFHHTGTCVVHPSERCNLKLALSFYVKNPTCSAYWYLLEYKLSLRILYYESIEPSFLQTLCTDIDFQFKAIHSHCQMRKAVPSNTVSAAYTDKRAWNENCALSFHRPELSTLKMSSFSLLLLDKASASTLHIFFILSSFIWLICPTLRTRPELTLPVAY